MIRDQVFCDQPMYAVIEEDILYVLLRAPFSGSRSSGIIKFQIQTDGSLCKAGAVKSTRGEVACHLCRFDGNTYIANYLSGSIYKEDKRLVIRRGKSIHPERQSSSHIHFVGKTSDENYLLALDLGSDEIVTFDRELNKKRSVKLPAGSGPRHFAYINSQYLAVVNELACSVSIFYYAQGALTLVDTIAIVENNHEGSLAAGIRCRGNKIYVSVRGCDVLVTLRWEDMRLSIDSIVPCAGKSPRDILLLQNSVFCMNEGSSNVTELLLSSDGSVAGKAVERLKLKNVLCGVVHYI